MSICDAIDPHLKTAVRAKTIFVLLFIFIFSPSLFSQGKKIHFDTVYLKKGSYMVSIGRIIQIPRDTFYLSPDSTLSKKEISRISRSNNFYDSLYRKMNRKEFTRLFYQIAFKPPEISTLPPNSQGIKSEIPYKKYEGKIIREIKIVSLDPFGPTVLNPDAKPLTGLGWALNKSHITTRPYIIRKNLFFKSGEPLDPYQIAENEKSLRDLPSVDNVRILVSQPDSTIDSIDVTVISKDVFSIGFDIVALTRSKAVFRIFDANFLGLIHTFSNKISFELNRAPFFRYDGLSYFYNNIEGTFIDGWIKFERDNDGNQYYDIGANRGFYSNATKWAGGLDYSYNKSVNNINDSTRFISYYDNTSTWLGYAFLLKSKGKPPRIIISESFYRRNYFSRPYTSIDSNRSYYNSILILSSLAYSLNNYYSTTHLLDFGKTENLPYGTLIQLDLGPEINDYYNRLYSRILLRSGGIIPKFGYISGGLEIGGFLNNDHFEDGVLKTAGLFISPMFMTADNNYKFRMFLGVDYTLGFNQRENNTDYTDISSILKINGVNDNDATRGTTSVSGSFTTIMYSPWYFYGFRFALLTEMKGGLVSNNLSSLLTQHFIYGFRLSLVTKNDNLVFPLLSFSFYFYPTKPGGAEWVQFEVSSGTDFKIRDFNFSPPSVSSLQQIP